MSAKILSGASFYFTGAIIINKCFYKKEESKNSVTMERDKLIKDLDDLLVSLDKVNTGLQKVDENLQRIILFLHPIGCKKRCEI